MTKAIQTRKRSRYGVACAISFAPGRLVHARIFQVRRGNSSHRVGRMTQHARGETKGMIRNKHRIDCPGRPSKQFAVLILRRPSKHVGWPLVEDNLAVLRVLAEEAQAVDGAVKAAQESLQISTYQYKAGTTSYLQVITTQAIALQNQRASVDVLTRRMVASVLLIEALGGGWDASQLPTASGLIAGK